MTNLNRRVVLGGLFTSTLCSPTIVHAAGYLTQNRQQSVRRLYMYSSRTGETINTVYWIDNEYISEAYEEINYFFRDWRTDAVKSIDLRTIDILSASYNLLDTDEPYMLLSGYRSPKTNAMLRKRSTARNGGKPQVAKNSLHLKGQAADVQLASRSVDQVARAAASCRGGGVGRYSSSNFVHMDCGNVRTWGR